MYSREIVERDTLNYFKGDSLATNVWIDKYCLKDKDGNLLENTPDDMHRRMAREFARIELKYKNPISEEEIYSLLKDFRYITPGGSILYGLGNSHSISSLGNCFVIGNSADSYGGILTTDQEQVQLMKRRAGVGHDISHLRSKHTPVSNSAGSSTGAVSFMPRFSNSTREVAQDGRRGALMLSISVEHQDIDDFVESKDDATKITGANISVKITDGFIKATQAMKSIKKESYATKTWDKIVHQAWKTAEPGVLFIDKIHRESPAACYGKDWLETSTNPCQPRYATVLTPSGISTIGNINIGDVIWSGKKWTKVSNKWSTGVKPVNKYGTSTGYFIGTENHRIVQNGEKIEVSNAQKIDYSIGDPSLLTKDFHLTAIMDGIVLGDGAVHKASNNLVHLYIGDNDYDYFDSEIASLIIKKRPGLNPKAHEIYTNITHEELPKTPLRVIPDRYFYADEKIKRSFLRGLFTANGSVCGERVCLKQSSRILIEQVREMLSSLGIHSYITTNKSKDIKFSNGTYTCKESYDINITSGRTLFKEYIGFIQKYKQDRIVDGNNPKYLSSDITSIEYIGEDEVFDITVEDDDHTYWTGGVLVSNCGEIPLCPYDSCRLLSVILPAYVNNPFKKDASFNWSLFKEHVRIAQRLMDDIIDLEEEKIDAILAKIDSDSEPEDIKSVERNLWVKIKTKLLQGRRTGLSGVGLADVLAMLGLKYDSDEAADVSEEIYKQLAIAAYESSVQMAEERGCFTIYNWDLEKDNQFINRIISGNRDLIGNMAMYGRRNIALLTIPPTGTLALMVKIASGVEPVFQPIHKRRRKVNPDHPNKSSQDKNGDWWEEYNVIHYGLSQYIASLDDETTFIPENTPYTGSSAMEIDPVKKVKMLGRIQKWIDHSISSTTNLPEDCTEQQVSDIYLEAWKAGMKGLTVYRDKCRDGVLISSEDKKPAKSPCFHQNNAPKRPQRLQCNIHFLEKKGFIVLVGIYEEIPYEIFAFNYSGKITETTGIIRKITGGRYNLTDIKGNLLIPDITSEMNQIEEDKTRLISWGLRHGGGLKFLVEQLSKAKNTDITSFSKAIARVLKGYIKDGVESQDKCPSCGGKLIYQSGCIECAEGCGYSKCG